MIPVIQSGKILCTVDHLIPISPFRGIPSLLAIVGGGGGGGVNHH